MSGSWPVSSPTSTMLITMGGKTPLASMGRTIVSPSLTLSWILEMAVEMMALPAVSLVMFRAWRIGTPLVTRVPRVREKREIAFLRVRSPKTGALSMKVSRSSDPFGVAARYLMRAMQAPVPRMIQNRFCWTNLLAPTTTWVSNGSGFPPSMSVKICSNLGTMKTSRKPMIRMAMTSTIAG